MDAILHLTGHMDLNNVSVLIHWSRCRNTALQHAAYFSSVFRRKNRNNSKQTFNLLPGMSVVDFYINIADCLSLEINHN